ncbi:MAG: ABC transporter permease [Pseudomonadota bacterium]
MFGWAALVFDLPLHEHLGGYALMATLSAACATAFALAVVTVCRTREQLAATSVVLVLLLAAVGGNLFPRFLMPEWLQSVAWLTFNGWALDGFQQVFWYGSDVADLGVHTLVLGFAACALFLAANLLALRWSRS